MNGSFKYEEENIAKDKDLTPDSHVLQNPINDPAWFEWHEVKKVEHYYLSVDAVTRPMQIKENPAQFGIQDE